jgi:hypothetical protein
MLFSAELRRPRDEFMPNLAPRVAPTRLPGDGLRPFNGRSSPTPAAQCHAVSQLTPRPSLLLVTQRRLLAAKSPPPSPAPRLLHDTARGRRTNSPHHHLSLGVSHALATPSPPPPPPPRPSPRIGRKPSERFITSRQRAVADELFESLGIVDGYDAPAAPAPAPGAAAASAVPAPIHAPLHEGATQPTPIPAGVAGGSTGGTGSAGGLVSPTNSTATAASTTASGVMDETLAGRRSGHESRFGVDGAGRPVLRHAGSAGAVATGVAGSPGAVTLPTALPGGGHLESGISSFPDSDAAAEGEDDRTTDMALAAARAHAMAQQQMQRHALTKPSPALRALSANLAGTPSLVYTALPPAALISSGSGSASSPGSGNGGAVASPLLLSALAPGASAPLAAPLPGPVMTTASSSGGAAGAFEIGGEDEDAEGEGEEGEGEEGGDHVPGEEGKTAEHKDAAQAVGVRRRHGRGGRPVAT